MDALAHHVGACAPPIRKGDLVTKHHAHVLEDIHRRLVDPRDLVGVHDLAGGQGTGEAGQHVELGRAAAAPPGGAPAQATCRYAEGKLTGGKAWVVGAAGSQGFLVVAEGDDGPVLVLAEVGAAGLVTNTRAQADGSSLGELSFSATPAEELASGAAVRNALAEAVADATALAAAELVGLCQRAFEITLDYIKTREQFDKPIGSFQVIQHRAVDLNVMCEVAQAGVREVLARMDGETDANTRSRLASRDKARAVTAARKVTRDAIQLHGAVGYTDEFDIGLYMNRALVLSAWLGDDAYHRRAWFDAREEEGAAQ